jgi:DNA polymerase-3 subunit delta'
MSVEAGMLPWHALARDRIATALASERLPHAVLLHGPQGVGKERFAAALASALLCARRSAALEPCGDCGDCALVRAGSHPDHYWLRRLEDKKSISVDQVREACEQLAMTSMRRGFRVLIIVPAHIMTVNAQNALLKTLEEPSPRTMIVLVTDRPSGLLATLRSRCQRVELARPDATTALKWLQETTGAATPPRLLDIAGGAPLKALVLAPHFEGLERQMAGALEALVTGRTDVVAVAAEMMGEGLPVRLDWLELWLQAVIRTRVAPDATRVTVPGGDSLQRAARAVNINACFSLLDRVRETRRLLDGSSAAQLVIESLLVECSRALGGRGVTG